MLADMVDGGMVGRQRGIAKNNQLKDRVLLKQERRKFQASCDDVWNNKVDEDDCG